MILESKYSLKETIKKLQDSSCTVSQYRELNPAHRELWPRYWGSVSNDKFQLSKLGNSVRGSQHLIISGRIFEKNNKTILSFWPMPNVNHIIIFNISVGLLVYFLIKFSLITIILLIALFFGSIIEFNKMCDEYKEFQYFVLKEFCE